MPQQIFRCTLSCIVDGQTCQNVLHLDSVIVTTPFTVADTIAAMWLDQILPFQHGGAVWVSIQVREIDPTPGVTFTKSIVMAGTGDTEREQDNPMLSRKLWLRSLIPGKHGRGRIYIPGSTQASWDKGRIKAASLTAGQPLVDTLMARFTGPNPTTGMRLLIKNRAVISAGAEVVRIEQCPILGSQRRRNIGVGI